MIRLQPIAIPWTEIDTVLLDMDGTLLDLHFDNYFWVYLVPEYYSKRNNLSLTRSKDTIIQWMADVQGTLDWYCIDYWDNKLNFDDISSSHELGYPKESQKYWKMLRERYKFSPESSLFIDDSQRILASAEKFGIGYLLGIKEPDSQREPVDCSAYTGIQDFSQLF